MWREYWRFDPTGGKYHGQPLTGERLFEGAYRPIALTREPDGVLKGYSAVLGLYLCWARELPQLYDPETETYLENWPEVAAAREAAEAERDAAETQAAVEQAARLAERTARRAAETRAAESETRAAAERTRRRAAEAELEAAAGTTAPRRRGRLGHVFLLQLAPARHVHDLVERAERE